VASLPGEQMKVVAPVPRLSATPGKVKWLGPRRVGQDGADILMDVAGLKEDDIRDLIKKNVLGA